jgi:hypothetical protein
MRTCLIFAIGILFSPLQSCQSNFSSEDSAAPSGSPTPEASPQADISDDSFSSATGSANDILAKALARLKASSNYLGALQGSDTAASANVAAAMLKLEAAANGASPLFAAMIMELLGDAAAISGSDFVNGLGSAARFLEVMAAESADEILMEKILEQENADKSLGDLYAAYLANPTADGVFAAGKAAEGFAAGLAANVLQEFAGSKSYRIVAALLKHASSGELKGWSELAALVADLEADGLDTGAFAGVANSPNSKTLVKNMLVNAATAAAAVVDADQAAAAEKKKLVDSYIAKMSTLAPRGMAQNAMKTVELAMAAALADGADLHGLTALGDKMGTAFAALTSLDQTVSGLQQGLRADKVRELNLAKTKLSVFALDARTEAEFAAISAALGELHTSLKTNGTTGESALEQID